MLISSEKSSLAITSIVGTIVNHSEIILLSHCLCYGLGRKFASNRTKALQFQWNRVGFCFFVCDGLYGNLSMPWKYWKLQKVKVLWGLHAHTLVASTWEYFWEEKNFAATWSFGDIETVLSIKYVCLLSLLLCFYVSYHNDICADEFCHWKLR